MNLEESLNEIKNLLLERYKTNLAGAIVLGSANTGHYIDGESDINTMVFVKELEELNSQSEIDKLTKDLSKYRFQSQYFHSLGGIKEYLKKRKSFATHLVLVSEDGSRILYSTPEFEELKSYLRKNPFTKEEIKEHITEKDKFELEGYMKKNLKSNLMKELTVLRKIYYFT